MTDLVQKIAELDARTMAGEIHAGQAYGQLKEAIRQALADAGGAACEVANDYNADGRSCRITEYLPAGTKLYTHPESGRVAELERERQISAELSRKVVALEQQLIESREREGRMRDMLKMLAIGFGLIPHTPHENLCRWAEKCVRDIAALAATKKEEGHE